MKIVVLILVLIAIVLLLKKHFVSQKNSNLPVTLKKDKLRYAVLIPARDESKVIEDLLRSLEKQTRKIESEDVYVIVESKQDKTVSIVEKHQMNIIYRKDLQKKRKGYALDDAIKEIMHLGKHYDAYFIFDADNVLDKNYIKEMEKSIQKGYDIGIGYRNCKNGNQSIYAAVSSLTFSLINTIGNEQNQKYHKTLTISGTGFYIKGQIIEQWRGYPFHSLTEDYELTLYAALHDYTTTYNKKAIFYDEQPTTYHQTVTQRTRWVRGYFDARKMYYKQLTEKARKKDDNYASIFSILVGVKPYLLLLVAILLFFGTELYYLLMKHSIFYAVSNIILVFLLLYFVLFLVTAIMLEKEQDTLNLTKKMKRKALFYNPFFLLSYLRCFIRAFTKKQIGWDKITHDQTLKIEK